MRVGDAGGSTLAARRLWSTERLLCASPDYLARHPVIQQRPADLVHHERITRSAGPLASHRCFRAG